MEEEPDFYLMFSNALFISFCMFLFPFNWLSSMMENKQSFPAQMNVFYRLKFAQIGCRSL
jgi:hypothetical protein